MNKEELINYIQQSLNSDKQLLELELEEFLQDEDRLKYLKNRIAIGQELLNDLINR